MKTKSKVIIIIVCIIVVIAIAVTIAILIQNNSESEGTTKDKKAINKEEPKKESLKDIYAKYFYENYDDDVYRVLLADITNDEQDEMIVVEEDKEARTFELKVFTYDNKKVNEIYKQTGAGFHAGGFINVYLYEKDNRNYFLSGSDSMWQGYGECKFEIFSLKNDGEKVELLKEEVSGSPVDDDEFRAFNKKYSEYAENSIEIVVTSGSKGIDKSNEYTAKVVFEGIEPKEKEEKTEEKIVNKIGNTSSNIYNHGQFASQGDYIFFADIDGETMYMMNKQYKNVVKIYNATGRISDINVIGDYIYYIENNDATLSIKKMKTGGVDNTTLAINVERSIYVTDQYIYYAKEISSGKNEISRMDLDGKNTETLVTAPYHFFMVNGDNLYFCGNESNEYKVMNLKTKEINNSKVIPFNAVSYNGRIFQRHQMKNPVAFEGAPIDYTYITEIVNGEEKILENTQRTLGFAIIDNKIYYTKSVKLDDEREEKDCLYCCNLDGSNDTLLVRYIDSDLIYDVDDEYIYFFDFNNTFTLKRIKKSVKTEIEEAENAEYMLK